MYQINEQELNTLLAAMRQIRQKAGETIAVMEHLIQLQREKHVPYNPDAYLEREYKCPCHPEEQDIPKDAENENPFILD